MRGCLLQMWAGGVDMKTARGDKLVAPSSLSWYVCITAGRVILNVVYSSFLGFLTK